MSRKIFDRGARGVSGVTGSGTLEAARELARAVAHRAPGESVAEARRRGAGALGVAQRVFDRLFYGVFDEVSPMTAQAVLANREAVLRAQITQGEAELRAVQQRISHLKGLWTALEGDGWGDTRANGSGARAGGVSSPTSCGGGAGAAPGSPPPSPRSANGCTSGRGATRATSAGRTGW